MGTLMGEWELIPRLTRRHGDHPAGGGRAVESGVHLIIHRLNPTIKFINIAKS